jgi:hypothetical protein
MNALTFNEKEFSKSDVRDLMKFMSMIQSDTRFRNNGRLFVNRFNESDDDKIKTMKTVEISFQFFKGKEKEGKSFIWKSYRAKDFCVSNSSIIEIL